MRKNTNNNCTGLSIAFRMLVLSSITASAIPNVLLSLLFSFFLLVQVSNLPYPLTDGIQFKKMMAAPVGRHWNTETRFTDMIRPRFVLIALIQVVQGSLLV